MIKALGIATVLLSIGLFFTGKWALSERDGRVEAEYNVKLREAEEKIRAEWQGKLNAVRDEYTPKIEQLEKDNKELNIAYLKATITASADASEAPIKFGDNLLRDFIRIDCLWASGTAAASDDTREACSREADMADPASAGVFFSVLDPIFIRAWGDACEELATFGGGAEWEEAHPGITANMCSETLLVMTPETSVFLRNWVNNGEHYTTRLIQRGLEQDELIERLTGK